MTSTYLDRNFEESVAELAARIRESAEQGSRLVIHGSGSKDFYGNATEGMPLDVRSLRGPMHHEPSELVLTVAAGTTLVELENALSSADQMLAFEPPYFGPQATVGGCVAAGLCGPRPIAAGYAGGALRDHMLRAKLLDGRGNLLSFGGKAIKNVAGYDVARLLVGSLGILGVLIEVSLKVVPRPATETTLSLECNQTTALQCFGDWNLKPWPISASAWTEGRLFLRLSGAVAAVQTAFREIGGDVLDDAEVGNFWKSVREQTAAWFKLEPGETLWRLSLPASAPALELRVEQPDPMFLEWHGMQRWLKVRESDRTDLGAQVHQLGGHLTRFRHGPPRAAHPPDVRQGPAFEPLAPALSAIHRRLKAEFDPHGIYNFNQLQPTL